MEKEPKPKYTLADFKGDFEIGQTGDDVKKMQEILSFFGKTYGYTIDQQELDDKRFGESTKAAADKLREAAARNPGQFTQDKTVSALLELVLQLVFHVDTDELSEQFSRGKHKGVSKYREANKIQFAALQAGAQRDFPTASSAANLALQYVGQREESGNRGNLVAMFCNGKQGVPWCGGFVDYVMENTYGPQIYSQANPLSAGSYETEARKHGAFHSRNDTDYTPKAGDVVVFNRQGGKHVGIITGISEDGTVSYVAGNSSNAVRESTYNLNNPPRSMRGYSATDELAAAKGIEIENASNGPVYRASAKRHADKEFARG